MVTGNSRPIVAGNEIKRAPVWHHRSYRTTYRTIRWVAIKEFSVPLHAMFPSRDIGRDQPKIRDWAQAAEELG